MPTTPPPRTKRRTAKRRILRLLIAGGIGIALGQLCPHLPEKYQPACQWAAKLATLLGGS